MKKMRRFIRNRILLPIANWLSGSNKRYSVVIVRDGVTYEAEYHRARYWYDDTPITITGIRTNRTVWHVRYLDRGTKGAGGCEMLTDCPTVFGARTASRALITATQYLESAIDYWSCVIKDVATLAERGFLDG
jgi:hypothetical protein